MANTARMRSLLSFAKDSRRLIHSRISILLRLETISGFARMTGDEVAR